LIARRSDDYLVLDPSFSMEPYGIDGKTITRRFTGQALLLKGCPRPSMRPVWLSFPLVLVSAGVIGTLLFTLAVWRWRKGSSLREVGSPCSEHPSG